MNPIFKRATKATQSKYFNLTFIYKNKKIEKKFENIKGSTYKDAITSISPYLTSDEISNDINQRKKLELDNDAYLDFEISSIGKYMSFNSKINQLDEIKVYDTYLTQDSFLDRVNPDKTLANDLQNHLFSSKNNFFDFFIEKQSKVSLTREPNKPSIDSILERINKYGFESNKIGMSTLVSTMNFLTNYKYNTNFNYKIQVKDKDVVEPRITWFQNISLQEKRYILGNLEEYDCSHETTTDFSEYQVVKELLNNDDIRFTKINNNSQVSNLESDYNKIINEFYSYSNTSNTQYGNIVIKSGINNNKLIIDSFSKNVEKIKKDIIEQQDVLYHSFINSKKAKIIQDDDKEDKIIKNIKLSKLFRLETEYANKITSLLLQNDSKSRFLLKYQHSIRSDIFKLFHLLRRSSQSKELILNRHQLGLFYSNGFAIVCLYSRPFYGEVESSFNHLVASKVYNLNSSKNGTWEVKEDIEEFVTLLHTYVFSYSEEIETIKDIYDMKNKV